MGDGVLGVTCKEEGREDAGGICLDSKVHEHRHVFREERVVDTVVLANGQLSEVIDVGLGRYGCLYATQGAGGGVDGHLAVEGGIEGVLGTEMYDIVLLATHLYAIGEEVVIVCITRIGQGTE
mgnify:CR=1 FL=1